jgi:hypothetical protein
MKILLLSGVLLIASCSNENEKPARDDGTADKSPVTDAKPAPSYDGTVAKPGAPFQISYDIIGTPIVGSPVAIDLRVTSTLGPQMIRLDYRIPDDTSMMLHEAQPARIEAELAADRDFVAQRVTIIPQREGRLFLNVGASVETSDGRTTTMVAIPIQVGEGGRKLEEQGELATDEEGEAIRVLTSE